VFVIVTKLPDVGIEGEYGVAFVLTLRKEFDKDASEGWKAKKYFGVGEHLFSHPCKKYHFL